MAVVNQEDIQCSQGEVNAKGFSRLERTLPAESYISPEAYAQEVEAIFAREWFCAGREEELPEPGDFLHVHVAGQSILVVRTRQSKLAAFYNVCRHRGAQLYSGAATKPGTVGRRITIGPTGSFRGVIRCPYHSWTYGLDGRLRSAPFLDESDGVDEASFPLYPVGLALWGGFFFLNLTPQEASARGHTLESQLGKQQRRSSVTRLETSEPRAALSTASG